MANKDLAKVFLEISQYLSLKDSFFEARAYEKAAKTIAYLDKDVSDIYKKQGRQGLEEIPGIGKTLAERIEEFLKTSKISKLTELKKEFPFNLPEILAVEGVGPKMAKVLYEKLGIKNVKDLEEAAKLHKISKLAGFGPKTEDNILRAISFSKQTKGRFLLGYIEPFVLELKQTISKIKGVKKVEIAGSFRRCKETIGDIDVLVESLEPKEIAKFFQNSDLTETIYGKGPTKISLRLKHGLDVDIRIIRAESFGAALQYFTGNKEHNIALRTFAEKKFNLKINEYGIFKGRKSIAGKTEKEIYAVLGMKTPPPEIRTNRGEIEAALNNSLPKLVEQKDIKGDLHMHTVWSDGNFSIQEMAKKAKTFGYQYIAITDHAGNLKVAGGLSEKKLLEQIEKVKEANKKIKNIKIFSGAEINIKKNGLVDVSNKVLSQLDWVVASVHSSFKMPKKEMTKRIIRAMENPYVKAIGHPAGRIIQKRQGYELDWEMVFKAAKATGTYLEINAFPDRLDINDLIIQKAIKFGLKLVINTDSHHLNHLKFMKYGICQARRGWAEKKDIINTLPLKEFEKIISQKRPF